MTRIDLGNYSLRVFHTPGHTIRLHLDHRGEMRPALFPLTACSPAARSPISPSREASATIWIRSPGCVVSVCARSYPGHGKISTTPIEDIDQAIANAEKLLDERNQTSPEIFYQKGAES